MADGLNFTVGDFPPGAIEYSSTEPISSAEVPIPSVWMSGLVVLGQMIWLRLRSKWETVKGSRSKVEISERSEEVFSR
ncbi:LOW QUALITY PROTEIN: uncharacterized protein Dere_GG26264 [Drosophila erecta]|uniref:Uncharacterized protein n=1 Tax=Drosophila erecta TaxID=7220 RepID=A0A0Q5VLP1_DROER|nr:LOW QUALITY PROTEIN: uncharacterized protein Dere_GG26264 [Drosophila erecta]